MGAENVNSETCTVFSLKALLGVVPGGGDGACSRWRKARLQVGSAGSPSSRHVDYDLHISLWKRSGRRGGRGWAPRCVQLPLIRWQIASLLACILSGSLPFRTPFPVSNLFISQDPRLSYLHVHCKCNVNESSDKIFLYFVISKEFLYGRTQRNPHAIRIVFV